MSDATALSTDVLVVGAGPAGSAAAAWAARAGLDVLLVDAAVFPRDKTCGDGLTPRAIGELQRLGLEDWLRAHTVNQGLRAHGFGQTLLLPWPGGSLPDWGSAVARTELDDHLRTTAIKAGARALDGARAVDVRMEGDRVAAVVFETVGEDGKERVEVACRRLVVADGVRSPLGKLLGREWHRETVYGVAGRSYVVLGDAPTTRGSAPTSSCAARSGEILSGYGWIFPLGTGEVNVGVGTLATARRPGRHRDQAADVVLRRQRREEFELSGDLRAPTSALLPMGGAVSNVAGPNWALIGDAAACVNPLNGEGIDYGLETGRLVVETMAGHDGPVPRRGRPCCATHYGESFSIARRLAGLVTVPRLLPTLGPAGHALGLADDAGAALDGQPRHRRGPRPRGAGVALGRAALAGPRRPTAVRLTARAPPLDSAHDGALVPTRRSRSAGWRCAGSTSPPACAARSTCPPRGRRCWPACTSPTPTSSSSGRPAWPAAGTSGSCAATTSGTCRGCGAAMDGDAPRPRRPRGAGGGVPPGALGCSRTGEAVCALPRGRHLLLVHGPLADARASRRWPARPGCRSCRSWSGAASGSPASGARSTAGGRDRTCAAGRTVDVRFGPPMPVAPGRRPRRRPPASSGARLTTCSRRCSGCPCTGRARGSTRRGIPRTSAGTRPTGARRCCTTASRAPRSRPRGAAGARPGALA